MGCILMNVWTCSIRLFSNIVVSTQLFLVVISTPVSIEKLLRLFSNIVVPTQLFLAVISTPLFIGKMFYRGKASSKNYH